MNNMKRINTLRSLSHYLNVTDPLIIPSFYLVVKRLMITKNSVVKVQKLVVNHKSQLVKSNTVYINIYEYVYIYIYLTEEAFGQNISKSMLL